MRTGTYGLTALFGSAVAALISMVRPGDGS